MAEGSRDDGVSGQTPLAMPGWWGWAVESLVFPLTVPLVALVRHIAESLWFDIILVYLAWVLVCPLLLYWRARRRARAIELGGPGPDAVRSLQRYSSIAGYSLAFFGLFMLVQAAVSDSLQGDDPTGMRVHNLVITAAVFVTYGALSALSHWYLRRAVHVLNERRVHLPDAFDSRFSGPGADGQRYSGSPPAGGRMAASSLGQVPSRPLRHGDVDAALSADEAAARTRRRVGEVDVLPPAIPPEDA
jgi:hypothetical protein